MAGYLMNVSIFRDEDMTLVRICARHNLLIYLISGQQSNSSLREDEIKGYEQIAKTR